ncbi:MAG: hypothetical protein PVH84_14545 [Candidatus Aminicenantes bacterium]
MNVRFKAKQKQLVKTEEKGKTLAEEAGRRRWPERPAVIGST